MRRTRRPWPVSTLETDGTFFRGRSLSVLRRSLLVAFDGEHVVAALIADPLGGVHLCVHGVGGDHYPAWVEGLEKLSDGGDLWLDFSATRAWVSTAPVAWSRADRRCGAEACPRRAPRTVLPSIAMTVLPSTVPVRVQNHDLRRVLRSVESRSCSTRRMVDSDGRACPASKPRDRRSDGVRSVVCSQMAVRLRQPASNPVTARDRTVNRLRRTPRRSRGSVMLLKNLPGQGLARQGRRGGG